LAPFWALDSHFTWSHFPEQVKVESGKHQNLVYRLI